MAFNPSPKVAAAQGFQPFIALTSESARNSARARESLHRGRRAARPASPGGSFGPLDHLEAPPLPFYFPFQCLLSDIYGHFENHAFVFIANRRHWRQWNPYRLRRRAGAAAQYNLQTDQGP